MFMVAVLSNRIIFSQKCCRIFTSTGSEIQALIRPVYNVNYIYYSNPAAAAYRSEKRHLMFQKLLCLLYIACDVKMLAFVTDRFSNVVLQ